ncbi:AAA family ATPase [Spirochaeta isovalerica]|uniref:Flagellar biosynthesis protein FlhG n=1 Tax=Spirochaeta isovalerica TaxID=150 RepID=A0A841RA57_9SPIO|nr:P-loop NTPase [Spirochaeta isovalerica]MBB6480783.1 flagellar biosynthesis protein FlhG [Spirochaeta isovalerica]
MVINENVERKIIPVAGGKGGVGKSFLSTSISLSLATMGKRIILIDLDLGGSNIHTWLGLKNSNPGIGEFLNSKSVLLSDLVVDTPYNNLQYIPGDVMRFDMANITFAQKKKIMKAILQLDADYIVIDLGAGSNHNVIDFFLISNSGFMVITPETTSIMNTYNFTRNMVFRFLQRLFSTDKEVMKYLKQVVKHNIPGDPQSVDSLISGIAEFDGAAAEKARNYLSILTPGIIINMAEEPDDIHMIHALRSLIEKNLNVQLECLGMIFYDKDVKTSLKERVPHLVENSESITASQIFRIAQKIALSENFPEMPYDHTAFDSTFDITEIEAENDFEILKSQGFSSEDYDVEKLLELIRKQREMIHELQGTISMLSSPGSGAGFTF